MKLKCSFCGAVVSTDISDSVIYDCWIECPSCVEKEYQEIPESKRLIIKKFKQCKDEENELQ